MLHEAGEYLYGVSIPSRSNKDYKNQDYSSCEVYIDKRHREPGPDGGVKVQTDNIWDVGKCC